ncbi:MAG: hypothetical protein ACRC14_02575 [Paracoccaceae bacterium]
MTAALHRLPITPEAADRLNRIACRKHLVEGARAALRSPALWSDDELRSRCAILERYGNAADGDYLLADQVLTAIRLRAEERARSVVQPPTRGRIRRELADFAGLALWCAAVVVLLRWGPV